MTTDTPLTKAEKQALNLQKGREASQEAKKARAKRVRLLLNLLQQVFPDAFATSYKPLKCEIAHDIIDYWKNKEDDLGELSKKCLRDTLQFYTSRIDYHNACLAPDATRVDLTGKAVSSVTEDKKRYHQERLDSLNVLQKKWAEQKAKKQQKKANAKSKPSKARDNPAPSNAVIKTDEQGRPVLSLHSHKEKG